MSRTPRGAKTTDLEPEDDRFADAMADVIPLAPNLPRARSRRAAGDYALEAEGACFFILTNR
jgi:hypothetical protein